jgi:hypothetical protein
MNYLSHGRDCLHDPYLLAGTAVPDWLRVFERKSRIPRERAEAFVTDLDPPLAALARGIVLHHEEDRVFHQCLAFVQLCGEITRRFRAASSRFRASVVSHIVLEMVLDDQLARSRPGLLEGYYERLEQLASARLEHAVERLLGRPVAGLGAVVERFVQARFLADYREDAALLSRLNAMLGSVRLEPAPAVVGRSLPWIRAEVAARWPELLPDDQKWSCAKASAGASADSRSSTRPLNSE